MISLTTWQQMLCVAVSQGRINEVAIRLRRYYDRLAWWKWIRRLRVRHQLRVVTVAKDCYEMGWQDASFGELQRKRNAR